jgi:hypothetical protein
MAKFNILLICTYFCSESSQFTYLIWDSHSGDRGSIFWGVTPYNLVIAELTYCLLHAGLCLAYSSALKVEVIHSSNMSDFHWPTWCYIPEDRTLLCIDLFPLSPMPCCLKVIKHYGNVEVCYIVIYVTTLLLDSNIVLNERNMNWEGIWKKQLLT